MLLPRLRGYRLEEEVGVLDDGTTVTKLVKVRQDFKCIEQEEEEDSLDTIDEHEDDRLRR